MKIRFVFTGRIHRVLDARYLIWYNTTFPSGRVVLWRDLPPWFESFIERLRWRDDR